MDFTKKLTALLSLLALATLLTACSPEIGSEQWCDNMKPTPKGDWTMNDAGDFTKHCIMK